MSAYRSGSTAAWPEVDCSDWPEPFDAFPVEAPFVVRPDLVKLAPEDDWLRVDRQWPGMLAAKRAALLACTPGSRTDNIALASRCEPRFEIRRTAAIARAIAKLAATDAGRRLGIAPAMHPEARSRGDGSVSVSAEFRAAGYRVDAVAGEVRWTAVRADAAALAQAMARHRGSSRLLAALASSLQEDLVLMERTDDGAVRTALFHVSFPSAWDPATKLGQDLFSLHAPVADNASLQAAAGRLGNALVSKGPFVRWVWTVTTDPRWRAWPPAAVRGAGDDAASRDLQRRPLYFRLERQTTMPLGEGYGLFLIRVQVRPLDAVLSQDGRSSLLQESLHSMSEDMIRYKNLAAVRGRLLDRRSERIPGNPAGFSGR